MTQAATKSKLVQEEFEGMVPEDIKELKGLAQSFVEARNMWQEHLAPMNSAHDALMAKMKAFNIPKFEFDGQLASSETTVEKERVKVNAIKVKKKRKGEEIF